MDGGKSYVELTWEPREGPIGNRPEKWRRLFPKF